MYSGAAITAAEPGELQEVLEETSVSGWRYLLLKY